MGLTNLLNALMGVKPEPNNWRELIEEGFVDSRQTTLASNYMILKKDNFRVLYLKSEDKVISFYETTSDEPL